MVIDPYRPGVTTRLGIGPKFLCSLNPRLIYAHTLGYRPDGKYGMRAGHDINYLSMSGILSIIGRKDEVPSPPANILGDFAGGGHVCVTGILLALLRRHVTGKGQVVTANMVDGSGYLGTFMRQQAGHKNMDRPRGENLLDGAAPFYEVYRTKDDRFMAVGAQEPLFYQHLLEGLGLDQEKSPPQWDRTQWPQVKELFAKTFSQKTMQEWQHIYEHTDACVTPVLTFDEVEKPLCPLVELSESPSLDVSIQEDYPELKKGTRSKEVLQEWVPLICNQINIDPKSKLLILKREVML